MHETDNCFAGKRYGVIGNGVSLGIENLLLAEPTVNVGKGAFICRVRRVGGVPCLGLQLCLNTKKSSFVLQDRIPSDARELGFLHHKQVAYPVYYDESPWPAYAPAVSQVASIWSPIAEILNQKSVYGVGIDIMIIEILEANREGCFLFDDDGDVLPSPSVVYNGAYIAEIASAVGFGKSRASPFASFGANYYFGTFAYARVYGVATLDGGERMVGEELVTRRGTDGIYKEGGIARYILMEGVMGIPDEKKWPVCVDTIYINKGAYDRAMFVVRDFGRLSVLDYAVVNTSKVRTKGESSRARIVFKV